MARISGNLHLITKEPIQETHVWVRSESIRASQDGVVIDSPVVVDVDAGSISFDAVPGRGVILLLDSMGRPHKTIPFLVPDGASEVSLFDAMSMAEVADETELAALDRLAQEILESYHKALAEADRARDEANRSDASAEAANKSQIAAEAAASAASESETNAAASAEAASQSETNAASSAEAASESETNAAASAEAASQSETNAANSEDAANQYKEAAASSASAAEVSNNAASESAANASREVENAKAEVVRATSEADRSRDEANKSAASAEAASQSETNAASSAEAAENSATTATEATSTARSEADRATTQASNAEKSSGSAAQYAIESSQHADRSESAAENVEGLTQRAESAAGNSESSAERAERAAQDATATAGGEVTESRLESSLKDKINSASQPGHTHTTSEIVDLPEITGDAREKTIAQRDVDGKLSVGTPTSTEHAATKGYVDSELEKKADSSHTHEATDITGLDEAMSGKAEVSHTHVVGDITELQEALDSKAAVTHSHEISEVSGLQEALDGKAASSHTHRTSDLLSVEGDSYYAGTSDYKNRLWKSNDQGKLYYQADPVSASEPARKSYVDKAAIELSLLILSLQEKYFAAKWTVTSAASTSGNFARASKVTVLSSSTFATTSSSQVTLSPGIYDISANGYSNVSYSTADITPVMYGTIKRGGYSRNFAAAGTYSYIGNTWNGYQQSSFNKTLEITETSTLSVGVENFYAISDVLVTITKIA